VLTNTVLGFYAALRFALGETKVEPATKRYVPARLTAGLKYHFSRSQLKFCIKELGTPDLETTLPLTVSDI
jgi:hypothetical protein